jgi:hypothetical protein
MENTQTQFMQPETGNLNENGSPNAPIDLNNKNNALLVLVNAAKIGQSKGVYTLEEAELISRAIRAFMVPVSPENPDAPQPL